MCLSTHAFTHVFCQEVKLSPSFKPTREDMVNFKSVYSCLSVGRVLFPFSRQQLRRRSKRVVKYRSQNLVKASGNLFCSNAFSSPMFKRCGWIFSPVSDRFWIGARNEKTYVLRYTWKQTCAFLLYTSAGLQITNLKLNNKKFSTFTETRFS